MNLKVEPGLSQMQRTIVVGTTGSGKTTMAKTLAGQLAIPHIELDALYWAPNWTPTPHDVFRERVMRALTGDVWVADGNYSAARDIVWSRADTLIWLDYTLLVIYRRLISRTLSRIVRREVLFSGNRETWRGALFSRNSLFMWALKTHHRRRRTYETELALPDYGHLTVWRFHNPQDAGRWLAQQNPQKTGP